MEWKHKCSLDWLRKRQKYLTASDIKSLLPVTKTGRPRKVTDADYIKVKASKLVSLGEEDCWSYGAAARGHILEPYAIEAFNETCASYNKIYYHWDDVLIDDGAGMAFSPDGMDIPMGEDPSTATSIVEVKSYNPERHMVTANTPKDRIEERWQIAHAMAVLPNINDAWLVLYNPSMRGAKLYGIHYTRRDLEDEIAMVYQVATNWVLFDLTGPMHASIPYDVMSGKGKAEWEIVSELEKAGRLNPT